MIFITALTIKSSGDEVLFARIKFSELESDKIDDVFMIKKGDGAYVGSPYDFEIKGICIC